MSVLKAVVMILLQLADAESQQQNMCLEMVVGNCCMGESEGTVDPPRKKQ